MRRFGSFVVLALVTALGCKSNVVPIQSGAYLNIYAEADGGPITGQSFNFPTACQGFPVSHEFFIENDSLAPVTIDSVSISSSSVFTLAQPIIPTNTSVDVGTILTQVVQFNPASQGPQPTATLIVASANGGPPDGTPGDGGPSSYTVILGGAGSNGPAQPTLSTTCGASTPCQNMSFPQTPVSTASDLPLTISNGGCPPLSLAISFVPTNPNQDAGVSPYSIVGAVPGTVNFGNAANLTVRYLPTGALPADLWDLVMTTNDGNVPGTMALIHLTGLSTKLAVDFVPPSPTACPLYATPIGTNGQSNVGETVVVPYAIQNGGELQIQVATPYIDDGGSPGFSVTNAWASPITLDGGDTATFDVSFVSPGAGHYSATVEVPVVGGALVGCQMTTRSEGALCSPDGGLPVQMLFLPGPSDPSNQLCGFMAGSVTLTNCGSANVDMCGIDAGYDPTTGTPYNTYYGIDAGAFGALAPGESFTFNVWFMDPATLNNPWIWTFNLCNDAPGYELTDAGGGGFQLTIQSPTIPVPQQSPPLPPVAISGLDDGGTNPVFGQQMHLLADVDAGLGAYYNFVWTAPAVGGNDINTCGDGGFGIWYVDGGGIWFDDAGVAWYGDGGLVPDAGPFYNNGGEAFVTPTTYWKVGDTHTPVCKICVYPYEINLPNGSCGFDAGFSPNQFHCFGGTTGLGIVAGP